MSEIGYGSYTGAGIIPGSVPPDCTGAHAANFTAQSDLYQALFTAVGTRPDVFSVRVLHGFLLFTKPDNFSCLSLCVAVCVCVSVSCVCVFGEGGERERGYRFVVYVTCWFEQGNCFVTRTPFCNRARIYFGSTTSRRRTTTLTGRSGRASSRPEASQRLTCSSKPTAARPN